MSLGLPPAYDNEAPEFVAAVETVLATCKKHGVVPGVHAGNAAVAKKRIEQGFRFVEMCDDAGGMARAAAEAVMALRSGPGAPDTAA